MKKGIIVGIFLIFCLSAKGQQWVYYTDFEEKPVAGLELSSNDIQLGITDIEGKILIDTLKLNEVRYFLGQAEMFFARQPAKGRIVFRRQQPQIEQVLVEATRLGSSAACTNISRYVINDPISPQNTGRDLPVLLQLQPSVVVTSDAGNGVGYTGIRVRGSDASRTNVTVNGVPINDAESQGTFWVNMPDLGSSMESLQLQNGLGSSTNGAGAFGASVNIQTASGKKPYGLISNSYGSFNTRKHTLAGGSGLIDGHWTVDLRLSRIYSDGFVDRASSDLSSWFVSAGYQSKKTSIKILSFSGEEKTYQAWYGVPIEKFKGDHVGLLAHYQRNVGFVYQTREDSFNLFQSGKDYNYYTYKNQVDNYKQTHYHLYFNRQFTGKLSLNSTIFLTEGKGYFEEYKNAQDVTAYGFQPFTAGTDTFQYSDLVRRRWLDNTLIGLNANLQWRDKKIFAILGGSISRYAGNHFGQVIWARIIPNAETGKRYYLSDGDKSDMNVFYKMALFRPSKMQYVLDLQVRSVAHSGFGSDNDGQYISFNRHYTFFNPKISVTYNPRSNEYFYGSLGKGSREPSRSDFTDNRPGTIPIPEHMLDLELGYRVLKMRSSFSGNFFYMMYKDQLVLTGHVNDVGTPLRTNVDKSFRTGIELSGAVELNKILNISGNVTASMNRILNAEIYYPNYDTTYIAPIHKSNTAIAFSPNLTGALQLRFSLPHKIEFYWVHKYVSRQYLDNAEQKAQSLDPYYFSEIWLNKSWKLSEKSTLTIIFQVMNLFNARYASNGYTYGYYLSPTQLVQESSVYPQAGRNFMGAVVLKF